MKKVLLLLLLVIATGLIGQAQIDKSLDSKMVEVWRGDVTGVYKNKGNLKIMIRNQPEWYNLTDKQIKAKLLQPQSFQLVQKQTNRIVGSFSLQGIHIHSGTHTPPRKMIYATLHGKFYPADHSQHFINTDLYIAGYRKITTYLDSSGYFPDKTSGPAKEIIHSVDRKVMVLVTKGDFLYGQGTNARLDNYNPYFYNPDSTNLMSLPSFYIDKYEVTNFEYYQYLKATNAPSPLHWQNDRYPKGKKDHPVIYLSYREVEGYARWVGKRIPTEFEWEKAARGRGLEKILLRDESIRFVPRTKTYPFGNRFKTTYCNNRESQLLNTVSVYELSVAGASSYGVIGMCGNAPEWTSSWYRSYPGNKMISTDYGKQYKVIRGGSFASSRKESTSFFRDYGGIPNLREDRKAGFRLVQDLP